MFLSIFFFFFIFYLIICLNLNYRNKCVKISSRVETTERQEELKMSGPLVSSWNPYWTLQLPAHPEMFVLLAILFVFMLCFSPSGLENGACGNPDCFWQRHWDWLQIFSTACNIVPNKWKEFGPTLPKCTHHMVLVISLWTRDSVRKDRIQTGW